GRDCRCSSCRPHGEASCTDRRNAQGPGDRGIVPFGAPTGRTSSGSGDTLVAGSCALVGVVTGAGGGPDSGLDGSFSLGRWAQDVGRRSSSDRGTGSAGAWCRAGSRRNRARRAQLDGARDSDAAEPTWHPGEVVIRNRRSS
ncbi:MAG: hypothetical protein WB765_16595, partial [Acidimicrobiales bacterium]